MTAAIYLLTDLEESQRKITNAAENVKLSRQQLLRLGDLALFEITKATSQGVDFRDEKFAPYSPRYLKRRLKKGRTTSPNLQFTGRMIAQTHVVTVQYKGSEHVALRVVGDRSRIALIHNAKGPRKKGAPPQRRWLDLDQKSKGHRRLRSVAANMFKQAVEKG
jgi:hypothetical protein